MRPSVPDHPIGPALDAIEADVLPTLSALLGSVAESARAQPTESYDARSAELRDMSRQIIELTQFLAAVAADASVQPTSPSIRA